MASTATQSATSSKKAESHASRDERDGRGATNPAELGKIGAAPLQKKLPSAEPERLDAELDDPYDNVACTD